VSAPGADLARALDLARAAALEAGTLLMEHFGHLGAADVRHKGVARDLVTAADLASERLLVARLRQAFPEHAIQAEEEVADAPDGPGEGRWRWYLDPLDGTVNFVHRLPAFCVSLGLYAGKTPLVGVVHAPRLGETFWASAGGGAFLNGERIAVSDTAELADAILATGFPYRRGELEHDNLENFARFFYAVRGLRRMGSAALDLAYTAAGRFDGYWELHLGAHDVAGGACLVREAGGVVVDPSGGDEWLARGAVVAAGPALVDAIRERVRA
jgi:myo-inositol-1(or 4)-monophosphatase